MEIFVLAIFWYTLTLFFLWEVIKFLFQTRALMEHPRIRLQNGKQFDAKDFEKWAEGNLGTIGDDEKDEIIEELATVIARQNGSRREH